MENVFLTPEVCSFDPGAVTSPLTPSTRSNHQSARKSRFRCFVWEMFFLTLRTHKQSSKQTIYVCKTLLYEKEIRQAGHKDQ